MKKNKYIVFATIGFELITLILLALWLGSYLSKKGFGSAAQAFCVLAAFAIWFASLILKLKKMKND
ncbi:MAG: hypothetical protein AABY53_04280 [Bdellovibrionota bacterium]